MIKISTSILSAKDRIECIKKLNTTTTDYIHIDVMDGSFVPNYQLPIDEVNKLSTYAGKPFDIHLMVDNPEEYINSLKCDNINNITIHVEIEKDIRSILNLIKSKGYKVGLSVKPKTNPTKLIKYLDIIDMVLVMSVEPGFGGQSFIPSTERRIDYIRTLKKDLIIEVDGGINNTTIKKIKNKIDIAVSGSYITNSDDYQKAINDLKN